MENDARFNTVEAQEQNNESLIRILDEVFATRDVHEWEERFKQNSCIYVRVLSPLEVITDPQALAIGFFAEMTHSTAGKMKIVASPIKLKPR